MARHSRQQTKRVDVDVAPDRNVQLQSNRRFFSASGNDRASREASALQNAFGVGQNILSEQVDRDNVKGEARAVGERGSGKDRDLEDKNFLYNKTWDEMDAERDVNLMAKELPEILRGAQWFTLEEDEVRGIISDYHEASFGGVDPSGFYGVAIAKPLIAQEMELISQHRQEVLDKIQMEQRGTIQDNVKSRYDASVLTSEDGIGTFPYDYLAEQTGIIFSGPNKRTIYWETLEHFAVTNGVPSIIENIPSNFPNGDPTGINDDRMGDSIRAAMTAANATRSRMAADELLVAKETLNSAALELVVAVNSGTTPQPEMIESYSNLPHAEATVTAALAKTLVALQSNVEDRQGDNKVISDLMQAIFERSAGGSMVAVSQAYMLGDLGSGKTGVNQYQELLAMVKTNDSISRSTNNTEFDFYLKDINERYPVMKGPLGQFINPAMVDINRQAKLTYHRARAEAAASGSRFDGAAEWEKVIEPFDARRERALPKLQPTPRDKALIIGDFLQNKATPQELQNTGLTTEQINQLSLTDKEKFQLYDGIKNIF